MTLRSRSVTSFRHQPDRFPPSNIRKRGFNRGLTSTSTRWEVFVGFTYLLPYRLW
jgi:hypothetical protein